MFVFQNKNNFKIIYVVKTLNKIKVYKDKIKQKNFKILKFLQTNTFLK